MSAPRSLVQFFDAFTPWLTGASKSPPWPDHPVGMEFYRDLMAANALRIMEHLFPSTRACVGAARWSSLIALYTPCGASPHWDLNQFGAKFSEWLAGHLGPGLEAELARFEWCGFEALQAPCAERVSGAPNPTAVLETFSWHVEQFKATAPPPEPGPVTLLLFRDLSTGRLSWWRPDRLQLIAFALASGLMTESELDQPEVAADALERARRELTACGALNP